MSMASPLAGFCISTYKRPLLLQKQLELISRQTFTDFEIIVSDNDMERSAEAVVKGMNDARFKYFCNETNLGMIKSFNKSIERSAAEYVVMVTDDDPVAPEMLSELFSVVQQHPGFPTYCGCVRAGRREKEIEKFDDNNFLFQLLHPELTKNFLWSSCLLRKETVLKVGGIPDYGSPHLADHALLALCSKYGGGIFINKMYGELIGHDQNFSKSNFELYYIGCEGFYRLIADSFDIATFIKNGENALLKHLEHWFIANSFNLRKHFTFRKNNKEARRSISLYSKKILSLDFMKHVRFLYRSKLIRFYIKYPLLALKSYVKI